jgi:hypothetical protein
VDTNGQAEVQVGSVVWIRSVRKPEMQLEGPAARLAGDAVPEGVVTIVTPGDGGLYRLTARTPLGVALLGHRAGDVIRVQVSAGTAEYEVVAVEPNPTMSSDAHAAGLADVAVTGSGGGVTAAGTAVASEQRHGSAT